MNETNMNETAPIMNLYNMPSSVNKQLLLRPI